MNTGKYIIIETRGIEVAIMFDNLLAHSDFLQSFYKDNIISAGFFSVMSEPTDKDDKDISVGCWGKSVTLNIKSRKEIDEPILKRALRKEY